ncbi:hypothetical protein BDN70DRAFT_800170 [Pholiota conissans]|uniref:Uncharacterized protein n=1 Tax=Pholiota conissans TaxID=109636 RepID=A0A9P5Z840_9AGAR|nr:hypothetical protein BDN70DRAFT_800170 [Pholiota conissans]
MILDKQPLPDDAVPLEAPPSYDTVGSSSRTTANEGYPPDKSPRIGRATAGLSSHPSSPSSPVSPALKSATSSTSFSNEKGKGRANWKFKFTESPEARREREIRKTILDLLRDIIQEHLSNSPAAVGILESCAAACHQNSVSFSSILQDKSIENRTPLYWAIVKRLPDAHRDVEDHQGPDLLSALLSYASPLSQATITELRLACLATSDQTLFHRLRQSPEFAPVSGVNQMLLGVTMSPDDISVEDLPGDGGGFAVDFVIPQFNKRMTVAREIVLEFIARSRMWSLVFFVASEPQGRGFFPPEPRDRNHNGDPPVGSWCIRLSLLETSPPTFVDSRLVISAPNPEGPVSPASPPPPSPKSAVSGFRLPSKTPKKKEVSEVSIRLTSRDQLQAARNGSPGKSIVLPLETSASGATLQYGNSPFIGADEKLRARFEARLERPPDDGADCVIC